MNDKLQSTLFDGSSPHCNRLGIRLTPPSGNKQPDGRFFPYLST